MKSSGDQSQQFNTTLILGIIVAAAARLRDSGYRSRLHEGEQRLATDAAKGGVTDALRFSR